MPDFDNELFHFSSFEQFGDTPPTSRWTRSRLQPVRSTRSGWRSSTTSSWPTTSARSPRRPSTRLSPTSRISRGSGAGRGAGCRSCMPHSLLLAPGFPEGERSGCRASLERCRVGADAVRLRHDLRSHGATWCLVLVKMKMLSACHLTAALAVLLMFSHTCARQKRIRIEQGDVAPPIAGSPHGAINLHPHERHQRSTVKSGRRERVHPLGRRVPPVGWDLYFFGFEIFGNTRPSPSCGTGTS